MNSIFSTKECPQCRVTKSADQFFRSSVRRDGASSWCKTCTTTKNETWRKKNQDRVNRYKRMREYGITWDRYVMLYEDRDGCCDICGKPCPIEGKHTTAINIDHDHETGKIRGLLCWNCNSSLGKMGEDPARLRAAADYLENR